jgi:hypothetical protein
MAFAGITTTFAGDGNRASQIGHNSTTVVVLCASPVYLADQIRGRARTALRQHRE